MGFDGFSVNVMALRTLNVALAKVTAEAGALADALGGISADTGRADSDQAGLAGPADAAALVGSLRATLHRDGGEVTETAATYVGVDDAARVSFEDTE